MKNDLEKLEIHYKNEPSYPGVNVIKEGKSLLINVLAINYSAEFFKIVDEKHDDFLNFAQDFEPVKAFFKGDQIDIWNRTIRLIKIYDESKTFIVNAEIESVVSEVKAIMKKATPYSEIRKIPELLDRYTDLYGSLLSEMEAPVLTSIDEARKRVIEEFEGKECKESLYKKSMDRFSEITEKANTCNNVAVLQNIKVEADALKVRILNEIMTEEARILASKQPIKPTVSKDDHVAENPPVYHQPKVKSQKTVSIKSINSEATWRIETEEDIDRYIESLKHKIKQSIVRDTILNIEF